MKTFESTTDFIKATQIKRVESDSQIIKIVYTCVDYFGEKNRNQYVEQVQIVSSENSYWMMIEHVIVNFGIAP